MKPIYSVLAINLCLLLVFFLGTWFLLEAPHTMPIFTTILCGLNIVGIGLGALDKRNSFIVAFSAGLVVALAAATISWILFVQNAEAIQESINL